MKPLENVHGFEMEPGDEPVGKAAAPHMVALVKLNRGEGPKSVHRRLQDYRKHSTALMDLYFNLSEVNRFQSQELDVVKGGDYERARKRWTEEEDTALIEFASREDAPNLMDLSLTFQRSPAAVSSRLTHLVGIRRITEALMGRITGYLNGLPVDGAFHGVVHRGGDAPAPSTRKDA